MALTADKIKKNYKIARGKYVAFSVDKERFEATLNEKNKPQVENSRLHVVFNFHGDFHGTSLRLHNDEKIHISTLVKLLQEYAAQHAATTPNQPITVSLRACYAGDSKFQVRFIEAIRKSNIKNPICLIGRPGIIAGRLKRPIQYKDTHFGQTSFIDYGFSGEHRNCVFIIDKMSSKVRIHDPTDRCYLDPDESGFCASSVLANIERLKSPLTSHSIQKRSIENIAILVAKGRPISQGNIDFVRNHAKTLKDTKSEVDRGVAEFIFSQGFQTLRTNRPDLADFQAFLNTYHVESDQASFADQLGLPLVDKEVRRIVSEFRRTLKFKEKPDFKSWGEIKKFLNNLDHNQKKEKAPNYLKALLAIEIMQHGGLPPKQLEKMAQQLHTILVMPPISNEAIVKRLLVSQSARALQSFLRCANSTNHNQPLFEDGSLLKQLANLARSTPHIFRVVQMVLKEQLPKLTKEQLYGIYSQVETTEQLIKTLPNNLLPNMKKESNTSASETNQYKRQGTPQGSKDPVTTNQQQNSKIQDQDQQQVIQYLKSDRVKNHYKNVTKQELSNMLVSRVDRQLKLSIARKFIQTKNTTNTVLSTSAIREMYHDYISRIRYFLTPEHSETRTYMDGQKPLGQYALDRQPSYLSICLYYVFIIPALIDLILFRSRPPKKRPMYKLMFVRSSDSKTKPRYEVLPYSPQPQSSKNRTKKGPTNQGRTNIALDPTTPLHGTKKTGK